MADPILKAQTPKEYLTEHPDRGVTELGKDDLIMIQPEGAEKAYIGNGQAVYNGVNDLDAPDGGIATNDKVLVYDVSEGKAVTSTVETFVSSISLDSAIGALTEATQGTQSDYVPTKQSGGTTKMPTSKYLASKIDAAKIFDYENLTMNLSRGNMLFQNSDNTKAYGSPGSVYSLGNRQVGVRCPTNTNGITITGDSKIIIGSNSCAFSIFAKINTAHTDGNLAIGSGSGASNYFGFIALSANSLSFITKDSAGAGTTPASIVVSIDSTKYINLVCVLDRTNSKIRLYKNNVLIGEASLNSGFGSITATVFYIMRQLALLGADVLRFDWFNFAPTASEVNQIWNNGRPDLFIIPDAWKTGSNVNIIPTNASQFTDQAGVDWWTATKGTIALNTDCMRLTEDGSVGDSPYIYKPLLLTIGKRYRIEFKMKSSAVRTPGMPTALWSNVVTVSGGSTVAGDTNYKTFIFEGTALTTSLRIYLHSLVGTNLVTDDIDDIIVTQQGSVLSLEPRGLNIPTYPNLTSTATTTVTAGNSYEISVNDAGYAFTGIGAIDNNVGTRFVATSSVTLTGTTRVKPCTVSSTASQGWYDSGANALHATVTNNPYLVLTKVEDNQGDGFIKAVETIEPVLSQTGLTPTFTIPAGHVMEFITIKNTHATNSLTFKLGSTASGYDLVPGTDTTVTINAGKSHCFKVIMPTTGVIIEDNTTRTAYGTLTGTGLSYEYVPVLRRVR